MELRSTILKERKAKIGIYTHMDGSSPQSTVGKKPLNMGGISAIGGWILIIKLHINHQFKSPVRRLNICKAKRTPVWHVLRLLQTKIGPPPTPTPFLIKQNGWSNYVLSNNINLNCSSETHTLYWPLTLRRIVRFFYFSTLETNDKWNDILLVQVKTHTRLKFTSPCNMRTITPQKIIL